MSPAADLDDEAIRRPRATNEPDRCVLIDATTSKEEVAAQIWRVVQKKLEPAATPIQFADEAV